MAASHEVVLVSHELMVEHLAGPGHPEAPERLTHVVADLRANPIEGTRWELATPAPRASIERVHAAEYVARIDALAGQSARLDADTSVSPSSVEAAYLAAGAVLRALAAVVDGESKRAFALVRPPGHHAERGRAMGFCLFNNVAVAASHAREVLGVERILIVDPDVHHGNGTMHCFYGRGDVAVFDVHQFPFYPGTGALEETGEGAGEGYTINVPLPAGSTDVDYVEAFSRLLVPFADRYRPELVLVSAGFDAHAADPLGGMQLSTDAYGQLMQVVVDLAEEHAEGRVVCTLEGGYALAALADSVRASVEVLSGQRAKLLRGEPSLAACAVLEAVAALHGLAGG